MAGHGNVMIYDIEVLSSMNADCGSIYCISYKWLGSNKVYTRSVKDYPELFEENIFDDSLLIQDIKKDLEQAEVLIGHNSKSSAKWGFDLKYINTRLLLNGFDTPIKWIAEVDTYHDLSKKHLKLRSNKLGQIAKALGLPLEKEDMDFPRDWNKVIIKKPGAHQKMLKYNKVDVKLTELVYLKLVNFHNSHPYLGITQRKDKSKFPCPKCGTHEKVNKKDTVYRTTSNSYLRLICRDCNYTFKGPEVNNKHALGFYNNE